MELLRIPCHAGELLLIAKRTGKGRTDFYPCARYFRRPPMANPAAASFYVTGGTLHQDAPSYVERQADKDLYEGLRRGEFCYVLTSRQMGKSSLMVRTAARLRKQGATVVVLDLTRIGQ